VRAYLDTVERAVSGKGGSIPTFRVACFLANDCALSRDDATIYLRYYSETRCDPPWSEEEIEHKLDDAFGPRHFAPTGCFWEKQRQPSSAKKNEQEPAEPLPYEPGCEEEPIKGTLSDSHRNQSDNPIIDWPETSKASTAGYDKHNAVYPPDSIFEDYVPFAHEECESADCFIIGAILPVCAAQLARKVRFPWGSDIKFPNLYSMLAGPAGDRKSSAIKISNAVAKKCLPASAFLPVNFSPETLFDEYDHEKGGRPDKLWIVDDANITLTDWRKTSNGDRVAARFLSLHDCCALTENYRRNKDKNQPQTKRTIDQTSTSIVFGSTFNTACFQGQAVRAGIARRFLFYVAEGLGRTIHIPELRDNAEFENLAEIFSRLNTFSTVMGFTPEAKRLWIDYQNDNRQRKTEVDQLNDAESSRLASEPMQTLSIAMIFQGGVCAKQRSSPSLISEPVLRCAIDHIAYNLQSARFLDSIADRESVRNSAEILLAKIRKDFQLQSRNGTILVRRNDITCKYAPHSGRQGTLDP
jgi:hypothetical protein